MTLTITPGDIVVIAAFDDVPEHLFEVQDVFDDCITGMALSGPFRGVYGEPPLELVLKVHRRTAGIPPIP